MNSYVNIINQIINNIERVIIGKRKVVELCVISLICNGHVLIEDVPGVGKTSLAYSIARSIDCTFKRIQFTPDILPSDITGFSVYNQKTNEFEYRPGLIMSHIILADEINRTSPKTQSSLLEVMEENQVTVDGVTYRLPRPFMVLATQNPVEYLGTFPLPEAQLDRFFMKVSIGYPSQPDESQILSRFKNGNPLDTLSPVATDEDIINIQEKVKEIYVDESLNDYIVNLVAQTRNHPDVVLGSSPRGSISLLRASQAWALYNGRDYVIPDDIKNMAIPVLSHRLILKQEAKLKKINPAGIIAGILNNTVVPVVK
ncbi:MAG TPA: MoxR family ATPase [Clostridiaceae bacterium]|nr:MoxR family ATPase [Clostridiaceae bacterium]